MKEKKMPAFFVRMFTIFEHESENLFPKNIALHSKLVLGVLLTHTQTFNQEHAISGKTKKIFGGKKRINERRIPRQDYLQ